MEPKTQAEIDKRNANLKHSQSKVLNRTILNLINSIEDLKGQMFHEFNASLDDRCRDVLDSANTSAKHELIRDLEEIERVS